jgi:Tol biopolymer transport system component
MRAGVARRWRRQGLARATRSYRPMAGPPARHEGIMMARSRSVTWRMAAGCAGVLAVAIGLMAPAQATVPGPDGLIAFRADTGSGDQLYTIRPDGTGTRQLTFLEGDNLEQPHWSPDGTMITFGFETPDTCSNVAYMNADGTGVTVLPLGGRDICEGAPTFSPDGARLFYEAYTGHLDSINSMRLDGTDRRMISNCEGRGATAPEVSPDGRLLAMSCGGHRGVGLFVSNVGGTHLHQVVPGSYDVGNKNDWSPDSRHIMFISQSGPAVNTATVRPDGTGLFWVTNYGEGEPNALGNTYSPDGQWIVMRLESDGLYALAKIHPDGTGLQLMTSYSTFRPRGMAWQSATL